MRYRYAKLINGYPSYAPNPIIYNGNYIGNPPTSIYEEKGYKPLVYTPQPDVEGDKYYIATWTETENEIIQGWEKIEDDIKGDEINE